MPGQGGGGWGSAPLILFPPAAHIKGRWCMLQWIAGVRSVGVVAVVRRIRMVVRGAYCALRSGRWGSTRNAYPIVRGRLLHLHDDTFVLVSVCHCFHHFLLLVLRAMPPPPPPSPFCTSPPHPSPLHRPKQSQNCFFNSLESLRNDQATQCI